MAFTLELFDRKGTALDLGDIVKISDGRRYQFFARVTWLEAKQVLAPFHTFSFHSFEKVDQLPEGLEKSTQMEYDVWYPSTMEAEEDEETAMDKYRHYLRSWRECEVMIENSCYRIKPMEKCLSN